MLATVVISFLINTYYPGKLFGFGASRQIRVCAKPICAALIMFGAVSIVDIADPLSMLVLKILVGVCVYSMVLAMMAPRIVKDIFLLFRG
jgi:hypothetical protein